MSSIHSVRAKNWGTTIFIAEWFANAAAYCQTKEGSKAFKAWLVVTYGKEDAKQKLLDCQAPPRKQYGLQDHHKLINSSAVEFGISDRAMSEYHLFTAESNICAPPRTKPAPKRRRGETSAEWLARRHDALLAGCKVPDIDWRIARALAISEFEKARDTFEAWHTDIQFFLEAIFKRSPTTLINSEFVGTREEPIHRMDYAFRASIHAVTLSYMTWGQVVDVFDELHRLGLVSTSAIERAYKQDSGLMWRLVSCLCRISYLSGHLWERFTEIMSWCEYYRPFYKRYRTSDGQSRVEINRTYLSQRGGYGSMLDSIIIEAINTDTDQSPGFFDCVLKYLDKNPSEATKFSSEAYEELGDLAIINEFKAQLFDSAFGKSLMEYAKSKDADCQGDPDFLPLATFMDPDKLEKLPRTWYDWAYARTIGRSQGLTWLQTTNQLSMAYFFKFCIIAPQNPLDLPRVFDKSWLNIDMALWSMAKTLDRKDARGTVARKFGLFNPTDPQRSTSIETMLEKVRVTMAKRNPPAPAAPSPVVDAPVSLEPSPAMSGHTYVADTKPLRAKEKVKTKGSASTLTREAADEGEEDEDEDEIIPDVLPKNFKMGKKNWKVFNRILEAPDSFKNGDTAGAKKGQIRWAEFERAMKRIGFGVFQTAGSSVRFDPPAKLAHPITFHRPHPDSILTPNLLRWVGARLKRCYGWTTATFERATDFDD
ncbi:hypothetical protein C8R43DRAFT_1013473 [Mycena crocata]|nr:hypothetical protein C8R43DRAFT_1013473 [Mycena crocata]